MFKIRNWGVLDNNDAACSAIYASWHFRRIRGKIDTSNTHIFYRLVSWLLTGTSIKSGGVKLVTWAQHLTLVKCYDHTSELYMWVKCQLAYIAEQAASLLSRTPQFLILNIIHNKPSCTYLLSKSLYVLYHRTVIVDFYYAWKCWEKKVLWICMGICTCSAIF
jgi:hypothetical protein